VSYGATAQGWVEADVQNLAEKAPGICDFALKTATAGDSSAGLVSSFTLHFVIFVLICHSPRPQCKHSEPFDTSAP
jgi:hypothetical protein